VFVERRNPTSTWAWAIVITFVPYIGFLLYLMFGLESRKHNVFMQKAVNDEETFEKFQKLNYDSLRFLKNHQQRVDLKDVIRSRGVERLTDMVALNYKSAQSAFTNNNSVKIYTEGEEKFDALLSDIKNAKRYIHMQYYIVRDSDIGRRIIASLAQKAREGVTVRFFIDGMGCILTPKKFYKPLVDAGGILGIFQPPHFARINFRNHRKIAVIDGITGYVGGLNIGDEYLGQSKRFGYWRDMHLRIYGDAVKQLELRFMMDWNFAEKSNPIEFNEDDFPNVVNIQNGVGMQIVSGGPDTKWSNIHFGYSKMIFEADKSIFIVTPYFVPDDTVFKALRIAALSGIDVRIMIPAHPDHPFVYWASLSYLGELLNAGVRCYKYEKGFVHSKMIVIDSVVSSVGTANMDLRSFDLNFEVNSFIYDEKISKRLEGVFFADIKDSTEITRASYGARSGFTRFKEAISRLISPLL
jgi:cardiolipin synthase